MDWHPTQGGVAMLSVTHATKAGLSSGCVGLLGLCAWLNLPYQLIQFAAGVTFLWIWSKEKARPEKDVAIKLCANFCINVKFHRDLIQTCGNIEGWTLHLIYYAWQYIVCGTAQCVPFVHLCPSNLLQCIIAWIRIVLKGLIEEGHRYKKSKRSLLVAERVVFCLSIHFRNVMKSVFFGCSFCSVLPSMLLHWGPRKKVSVE